MFSSGVDIESLLVVLATELRRVAIRSIAGHLLSVSQIAGGLVRAASLGVIVVSRDSLRLTLNAARRSIAVHRSVSAIADRALAVDANGAVSSSAERQISGCRRHVETTELDELVELVGVRVLSHVNKLLALARSEEFISIIDANRKQLAVSGATSNARDSGLLAGRELNKASGRGTTFIEGENLSGLGAVGRIGGSSGDESKEEFHY